MYWNKGLSVSEGESTAVSVTAFSVPDTPGSSFSVGDPVGTNVTYASIGASLSIESIAPQFQVPRFVVQNALNFLWLTLQVPRLLVPPFLLKQVTVSACDPVGASDSSANQSVLLVTPSQETRLELPRSLEHCLENRGPRGTGEDDDGSVVADTLSWSTKHLDTRSSSSKNN